MGGKASWKPRASTCIALANLIARAYRPASARPTVRTMMIRSMKLSEYRVSSAGIVGSPKRSMRRSSGRSGMNDRRRRSSQSRQPRKGSAVAKLPRRIPFAPSSRTTTSQTVAGMVTSTLAIVSPK
jgi:hypothetical protein